MECDCQRCGGLGLIAVGPNEHGITEAIDCPDCVAPSGDDTPWFEIGRMLDNIATDGDREVVALWHLRHCGM